MLSSYLTSNYNNINFSNLFSVKNEECDSVFSGYKSLSEEENMSLAIFLNRKALNILAFINLRSFDDLVTIPYGYTTDQANNYPILVPFYIYLNLSLSNLK